MRMYVNESEEGKKMQFAFFCSINIFNKRLMFGNFMAHAQCTVNAYEKREQKKCELKSTSFCIIFTPSHQIKSHTVSLNIEYVKHLRPFSTPRFFLRQLIGIKCIIVSRVLFFYFSTFPSMPLS